MHDLLWLRYPKGSKSENENGSRCNKSFDGRCSVSQLWFVLANDRICSFSTALTTQDWLIRFDSRAKEHGRLRLTCRPIKTRHCALRSLASSRVPHAIEHTNTCLERQQVCLGRWSSVSHRASPSHFVPSTWLFPSTFEIHSCEHYNTFLSQEFRESTNRILYNTILPTKARVIDRWVEVVTRERHSTTSIDFNWRIDWLSREIIRGRTWKRWIQIIQMRFLLQIRSPQWNLWSWEV